MTERFRLKVNVTRQRVCEDCPIAKFCFQDLVSSIKKIKGVTVHNTGTKVCRIAKLERKLHRVPTYIEIEKTFYISERYWLNNIPENCPNRYLNPYNLPASKRKG